MYQVGMLYFHDILLHMQKVAIKQLKWCFVTELDSVQVHMWLRLWLHKVVNDH